MMNNISIPYDALELMQRLEDAGESCWIVGGCVRDSLMGKVPSDWDMTTSASPKKMEQIFSDKRLILQGKEHGTVGVVNKEQVYEITTFRVESGCSDHRHPDRILFTDSVCEDLARRDFTVNAMAYHPKRGLLDCFGGQQDLQNKLIRCVGKAEDRFEEDALRILRALRFCASLNFQADKELLESAEKKAALLKEISVERIWTELEKLLVSFGAADVLCLCKKVWQIILPQLLLQKNIRKIQQLPTDAVLRLIWLYQQENLNAANLLKQLHCPKNAILRAENVWKIQHQLSDSVIDFRHLLNQYPEESIEDFLQLTTLEAPEKAKQKRVYLNKAKQGVWKISHLCIDGNTLIEQGFPKGKIIGCVLAELLELCMQESLANTKADLLQKARQIIVQKER